MANEKSEKQKVQEITERLEQGISEVFESEQYKKYLSTISKFHDYSYNNNMLISMQKPDATVVAGYKAWQKNFGRQVKKGERGIRILAPAPYKVKEEQDVIDPVTQELVLDEHGKPLKEEVEYTIPAFRVVTVFDVSQTEGRELPDLGVDELLSGVEGYEDFMQALADVSPVPISFENITDGSKGYFHRGEQRSAVKQGMSESQTIKTCVHEIAHAKLHDKVLNQSDDPQEFKSQETMEVEAESVAYVVCQHFGIDTSEYSFEYIAGWSSGKDMKELKDSLKTIQKTASGLITEIEARLLEIQKEKTAEQAQDMVLLVSNTERSEYDLLNVRGINGERLAELLAVIDNADREDVRSYLKSRGAEVILLADEQTREVREYHLDYIYNTDTYEFTDIKAQKALEAQTGEQPVPENSDWFEIYQLKDTEETQNFRFMALDYLEMKGIAVTKDNYHRMYKAPLEERMTLEGIFEKFNIDRPADFTGHSLSVSDVVVLHQNGEERCYYTDSIGFQEVPEFAKERSVSKEEQEKKVQPEVSYYVIGDLSTWARNSESRSMLERFDTLDDALEIFSRHKAETRAYPDDDARTTLGVRIGDIEFDVVHVRQGENYLVQDFTQIKAAQGNSHFLGDLQEIHNRVGFDRTRVHREMTPEEIRDFVKQRFEYQLKSSGLEEVSLYMGRFDALYEQGKMGDLMPSANQKRITEDLLFTDWENPYIEMKEAEPLAVAVGGYYIGIQSCEDGYDYSIFYEDYRLFDGGVYDNPDISIHTALGEIIEDLREQKRIPAEAAVEPVNYDALMEWTEAASQEELKERIQAEVPEKTITLTVAECGEFHSLGEYHENIASVEEAIAVWKSIPPERMNGIPSIGIRIHTEGTESYEDVEADILSGGVIDLEMLDYEPDITDDPKAVKVIAELIDKLPDIEVRGSLEKWQASILAAEIDQLSYDYDTYEYRDTVEDRDAQVAGIMADIRSGNTGYLQDFLQAMVAENVREGITDLFGEGMDTDSSEAVQMARRAQELLDRLAEYKPLAKIEELEEQNYNMVDNVLNNGAGEKEREKSKGRISVKEKLSEKKAVIEQRDRAERSSSEKEVEKKSQREI